MPQDAPAGQRSGRTPTLEPGRKWLFIDETHIGESNNVTRTLNQFERAPQNPILEGSKPWEYWTAYPNGRAVLYDEADGTFKYWYLSPLVDESRSTGIQYRTLYAESKDGITWTKPNLGLVEWDGSPENNILPWGTNWMRRPNVIKDPNESNPDRLYKMMYADWEEEIGEPAVYKAYSGDGIHWDLNADDDPLYPRHNGNLLGYDPRVDRYVRYGRGDVPDHPSDKSAIKRATSPDFESWSEYETVLTPAHEEESFHGLAAFKYHGLYLGWLWVYDRRDGPRYDRPELVVSPDGINWERPFPREGVIPRAPPGAWDHDWIRPVAPVVHDDRLWCIYGGQNMPYGGDPLTKAQEGWTENGHRKQRATGVATVRLDGFVSVGAPAGGGWVTTPEVEFAGESLFVNVDAAAGTARVSILDDNQTPIPGFTEAETTPVGADRIRAPVEWSSERSFGDLTGGGGHIKIRLQDADLFAVWSE